MNCLLHGIPDCLINKLQRVQNSAAWLVVHCGAQHRLAPAYITDLLHKQRATRVLRSATNNDSYVPPSHSRYGDSTFLVSAP